MYKKHCTTAWNLVIPERLGHCVIPSRLHTDAVVKVTHVEKYLDDALPFLSRLHFVTLLTLPGDCINNKTH
jgi:hypothetical protein